MGGWYWAIWSEWLLEATSRRKHRKTYQSENKMRYPTNIQKIERENRQKKREELCEIAIPLKSKRNLKSHELTRSKYLPKSRECWPNERNGKGLSEDSTIVPKYLSKSRESWPKESKDEALSSSSMVEVIQI